MNSCEIILSYETTSDKNDYQRRVKLGDLFIEKNLDISKIQFKNPEVKFSKFIFDEWSIYQLGAMGWGLFPNNIISGTKYKLYENEEEKTNYNTTPEILEIFVDLSSFYDDPTPFDFENSPRISSTYVAGYFWNEIVKAN